MYKSKDTAAAAADAVIRVMGFDALNVAIATAVRFASTGNPVKASFWREIGLSIAISDTWRKFPPVKFAMPETDDYFTRLTDEIGKLGFEP